MIRQIRMPLSYVKEQLDSDTFDQRVAIALEQLNDALNRGYVIVSEHQHTTTIGTQVMYVLHKRKASGRTAPRVPPPVTVSEGDVIALLAQFTAQLNDLASSLAAIENKPS